MTVAESLIDAEPVLDQLVEDVFGKKANINRPPQDLAAGLCPGPHGGPRGGGGSYERGTPVQ